MMPDAALSPFAPLLLALASLFPLALLALTLAAPGFRPRLATLLWLAPLPGLMAAVFAQGAIVSLPTPLALGLMLDRPGALLLGSAALIWCAAGIAAPAWWGEKLRSLPYQAWWLATLAGSMTVFIAADVVTFYLAFSLVSLAGYGLVTRDGTVAALKAGRVYFAAGSFEPIDFHNGMVDVDFNMIREVREETGLDLSTAERGRRWHALSTASGTVIFRRYRVASPADDLARRIRAFVAAEAEPEIEGPVIIRNAADLPDGLMAHMKPLIEWHFANIDKVS